MKPFVYSTAQNRQDETNTWRRGCDNVCYYRNNFTTRDRESAADYEFDDENIPCYEFDDEASRTVCLNTLSFCYEFEHDNDTVFFAYFQPYTLSDLEDFMFTIKKQTPPDFLNSIYKQEKLCQTLAGNPCYCLTITSNVQEDDCIVLDHEQVKTKAQVSFEAKQAELEASG